MKAKEQAHEPKSAQILAQIAERRNRIRELTDQRNALSDTVEKASDAVAAAIARKSTTDVETERARVRSGTDEINEINRALALLEKEIVPLQAELKDAQRIEAIALAQTLDGECRSEIHQLRERVDDFVAAELARVAELQGKIRLANNARSAAKVATGTARVDATPGLHFTPLSIGRTEFILGAFVEQMDHYAQNQRMETNRDRRRNSANSTEPDREPAVESDAVTVE